MSDLKPCPACGGKAYVLHTTGTYTLWRVSCEPALCISTSWLSSEEGAIALWNSLPRREEHREEMATLLQMGAIGPQLRDEDRERRRFEAAVATMQSMTAAATGADYGMGPEDKRASTWAPLAEVAVAIADALIAELAKEKP